MFGRVIQNPMVKVHVESGQRLWPQNTHTKYEYVDNGEVTEYG